MSDVSLVQRLAEIREQIERTFQREIQAAEAKRQRALDALGFLTRNYAAPGSELAPDARPATKTLTGVRAIWSQIENHLDSPGIITTTTTLNQAIQEAALKLGKFTRAEVVNYINRRYPELKATEREASIASMLSRLNGVLIETAHRGVGTEPHVFRVIEPRQKPEVSHKLLYRLQEGGESNEKK